MKLFSIAAVVVVAFSLASCASTPEPVIESTKTTLLDNENFKKQVVELLDNENFKKQVVEKAQEFQKERDECISIGIDNFGDCQKLKHAAANLDPDTITFVVAAAKKAAMDCKASHGIAWDGNDPDIAICNLDQLKSQIALYKIPSSEAQEAFRQGLHHLGNHNEVFKTSGGYWVWLSPRDPEFFTREPADPSILQSVIESAQP